MVRTARIVALSVLFAGALDAASARAQLHLPGAARDRPLVVPANAPNSPLRRVPSRADANRAVQHVNRPTGAIIARGRTSLGTRTTNCVACAMAADDSLDGRPTSAMPGRHTFPEVIEAEYGRTFTVGGHAAVVEMLMRAGPGSRAIVMGAFANGAVHAFNAVHTSEGVVYVDAQTGRDITRDVGSVIEVQRFFRTDDIAAQRARPVYRRVTPSEAAEQVQRTGRALVGTTEIDGREVSVRLTANGGRVSVEAGARTMSIDALRSPIIYPEYRRSRPRPHGLGANALILPGR